MAFINSIPQPTDLLKTSQPQLLGNNQQLDTSFGIDHYTFSNLTTDNGKHNQVTTPKIVGAVHPTTAANEPKFYAMEDSANAGVLQYSRGGSDAIPSPITRLHGLSLGIVTGGTANIFDFTGLTRAIAVLTAYGNVNPLTAERTIFSSVFWTGTTLSTSNLRYFTSISGQLFSQVSGNIIQIRNQTGSSPLDVYWTLEFQRMQ